MVCSQAIRKFVSSGRRTDVERDEIRFVAGDSPSQSERDCKYPSYEKVIALSQSFLTLIRVGTAIPGGGANRRRRTTTYRSQHDEYSACILRPSPAKRCGAVRFNSRVWRLKPTTPFEAR